MKELALTSIQGIDSNVAIGALALAATVGVLAGARYLASTMQAQMQTVQQTAAKVAVTTAFLAAVFFAAKAVLEV